MPLKGWNNPLCMWAFCLDLEVHLANELVNIREGENIECTCTQEHLLKVKCTY